MVKKMSWMNLQSFAEAELIMQIAIAGQYCKLFLDIKKSFLIQLSVRKVFSGQGNYVHLKCVH